MGSQAGIAREVFLGMEAIVASPEMQALMERVKRFAASDASVLVTGESGSGKEIVARALGHYSPRADRGWVDVCCGAMPDNLMESELFGFEKGAFSSADHRKQGLFEVADGGTLFLDEIGELDLRLQVKLLRVLDSGEFYRLGGTRKIKVDVRILAATNQDLGKMVAEGRFRKDLYHRLAQLRVSVPALRTRAADVTALIEFFRQRHCPEVEFSREARRALLAWHWPGNVRELRNAVISAGAVATGGEAGIADLPEEIGLGAAAVEAWTGGENPLISLSAALDGASGGDGEGGGLLEAMERRLILRTLDETGGHQERAAAILGISSRTLSRKLKLYAPAL